MPLDKGQNRMASELIVNADTNDVVGTGIGLLCRIAGAVVVIIIRVPCNNGLCGERPLSYQKQDYCQ